MLTPTSPWQACRWMTRTRPHPWLRAVHLYTLYTLGRKFKRFYHLETDFSVFCARVILDETRHLEDLEVI